MTEAAVDPYLDAAREAQAKLGLWGVLRRAHLSENVTYEVQRPGSSARWALRLHRPGYQSLAALRSERIWIRALTAAGLQAPEPVANADGDDLVKVAVTPLGEERWASASLWVEGEILGEVLQTTNDPSQLKRYFGQLGALLARAHNQSCGWTAPAGFTRPRLDADGLVGAAPVWGPFWKHRQFSLQERDLMLRTRDAMHACLLRHGVSSQTFGLIHADLHPGNVVVQPGGLALIDFDDAAFGWHVFDLAVALIGQAHTADFTLRRDACVAGYRRERAISDEALALLPLFLLARGMNQMGWLHERPEIADPPGLDRLKAWVCDQADAFIAPA